MYLHDTEKICDKYIQAWNNFGINICQSEKI